MVEDGSDVAHSVMLCIFLNCMKFHNSLLDSLTHSELFLLTLHCYCVMCVLCNITEEGGTGVVEGEGCEEVGTAASPQSQLVRWKPMSHTEVQVSNDFLISCFIQMSSH